MHNLLPIISVVKRVRQSALSLRYFRYYFAGQNFRGNFLSACPEVERCHFYSGFHYREEEIGFLMKITLILTVSVSFLSNLEAKIEFDLYGKFVE